MRPQVSETPTVARWVPAGASAPSIPCGWASGSGSQTVPERPESTERVQRALREAREDSESTQRVLREHPESTQRALESAQAVRSVSQSVRPVSPVSPDSQSVRSVSPVSPVQPSSVSPSSLSSQSVSPFCQPGSPSSQSDCQSGWLVNGVSQSVRSVSAVRPVLCTVSRSVNALYKENCNSR